MYIPGKFMHQLWTSEHKLWSDRQASATLEIHAKLTSGIRVAVWENRFLFHMEAFVQRGAFEWSASSFNGRRYE